MKMAPEVWDHETILALIKLAIKLVALGAVVVAGTDGAAALAESQLQNEQGKEAAWVERDRQRELIEDGLVWHAKCDTALETFSRHRDEEADWNHVLATCHSEGEIHAADEDEGRPG